ACLLPVADGGHRRLLHAIHACRGRFFERRQSRRVVGRGNGVVHVRLFCLDIHWRSRFRVSTRRHRCLPDVSRGACVPVRIRLLRSSLATFTREHGGGVHP